MAGESVSSPVVVGNLRLGSAPDVPLPVAVRARRYLESLGLSGTWRPGTAS